MPNTQSQEKKDALRLCGAELREVPAVPYKDPNNYVHIAARTAKELEATEQHGVLYANQWDNHANRDGHTREHRSRDLGSRPTARSTASSAPSAPAARWPASARS